MSWKRKYAQLFFLGFLGWMVSIGSDAVDVIVAGSVISDQASSAVELVSPIPGIYLFLAAFLAVGCSTLFSEALGAFDKERAYRLAGLGVLAALVLGPVLCGGTLLLQNPFFAFYEAEGEVLSQGIAYYRTYPVLGLLYPLFWVVYYLVTIEGDVAVTLCSDLTNLVTNLILSVVLGKKFGIAGIGAATVISYLAASCVLAIHFFRRANGIRFRIRVRSREGDRPWKDLLSMVRIGSATALASFYLAVTDLVMNRVVIAALGEERLASYAAVNLILNLAFCFVCGEGAAGPFVCLFFGEGNGKAVKQVMRHGTRWTLILAGVFSGAVLALSPLIPGWFGIRDPGYVRETAGALRMIAFCYPVSALVSEWVAYLPRVGKAGTANLMGILHNLAIPLLAAAPLTLLGLRAMAAGFFLAPLLSLLSGFLLLCGKKTRGNIPFAVSEDNCRYYRHFDRKPEEGKDVLKEIFGEIEKLCAENGAAPDFAYGEKTFSAFWEELPKGPGEVYLLGDASAAVLTYHGRGKRGQLTERRCFSVFSGFSGDNTSDGEMKS